MAEQLFRVCPECGGRGYIETEQRIEISPENEFAIRASCVACSDTGYIPVDAPEPLTGEEVDALAGVMHDDMHGNSDFAWSSSVVDDVRDYRRKTIRAVIAALPERFGVRIAALSQEDHDGR